MAFEIAGTLALIIVSYITYVIAQWAIKRREIHKIFVKYGIPGPKPNFLDGNMNELKAGPTPNDVITKWLNKYGPVLGFFFGETPYMVIKDLEAIKQVLIKDFTNFTDRPVMYTDSKPLCDTVIALQGGKWKLVRNMLTPTFTSSKMKLMYKVMSNRASITVESIEKHAKNDEMFDIYQNFQGLTLDVIADCALAMKVECQKNLNDPLLIATRDFIRFLHSNAAELAIKYSFLAPLFLFLARFLTIGQLASMVIKNVEKQIAIRRSNPTLRKNDLLQTMLEASDSDPNDPNRKSKVQLSNDELAANAFVFILAGFETTSTALAFTFWHLIQNPEIQEKLYHEVVEACGDEELSYDKVQGIEYLDQVLNESLRLHPPVTGFTSRVCAKETKIEGYTIPEGVVVYVPIWDLHRDPDQWSDPTQFDPDRFAKENKLAINSMAFQPFGHGPRNCIGMRFAQLEAKLAMAELTRKFKFVSCEKTDKDLTLIGPTFNINPANGVYCKAIFRDKQL